MYNKNAYASLWNREGSLEEILFCVSEHAWIYLRLFPKIKKSKAAPSWMVGTDKAPWHLILAEIGLWGKRGRVEFLKPFNYYMAELINSLLIPRHVRHKIFQPLPRWSMLAHYLPVGHWILSISSHFPPHFDLPITLFLSATLVFLVLKTHMSFSVFKTHCI